MGGVKKYQLRTWFAKLTKVKTWQFLLILILCLFITATFLRFDHVQMTELKEAVLAADEKLGEIADQEAAGEIDEAAAEVEMDAAEEEIVAALTELQQFTFSHTVLSAVDDNGVQTLVLGTGPFYLQNQYERAANAAIAVAQENAASDDNPNGNIYAAAMGVCKPQAIANGWRWNSQGYLDCMTGELEKYPTYDYIGDLTADVPSTELYRYNYASPIWSFTPAGIMMIIDVILLIIVAVRLVMWVIVRVALIFLKKR